MLDISYDFCMLKVDELLDADISDENTAVDTGYVWSIRLLAARACVKILQRSNFLVYDVLYTRTISRIIYSLINPSSPPSVIYAILCLFEQLGSHASRVFLLPYLLDIDSTKMFSSKSILVVLERIAVMIISK
jgi:hypothetical protein